MHHPHGCGVIFTVRQLRFGDQEFARDCEMVAGDSAALKDIREKKAD